LDYRFVQKTGYNISALGYGCMRFVDDDTAAEAVKKAVELGVNYFDVAPAYCCQTSERRLGLGLKGLRDKVIVTAKSTPGNGGDGLGESCNPVTGFGIRSADETRRQIERSMELIGIDHLDMYHLWGVHSDGILEEAMKPNGFLEGARKAQSEGLFDHMGITTHADADSIIRYLDRYDFDTVTLPFHLRDTSRAKAVAYCAERGIGVIAMNPLAGGALTKPVPVLQAIAKSLGFESMTEAALRFLASYPGVTTSIAGIACADQAVEDAAAIEKGKIPEDISNELQARVQELYANVRYFCSACGYCGDCPQGILIPEVLELYSNMLVPSTADAAILDLAQKLAADPTGYDPSLCTACKACETQCPNKLPVSQLMAAASEMWPSKRSTI
jgi:predicted aldo/keto reductase-like oxidoreductase